MHGSAFSIEDALIASRWAEQILWRGYRVVITPTYYDADEVIEVYIRDAKAPTFKMHRVARSVFVTDCIGLMLVFPTLADALLAMAPLSRSGERAMWEGAPPAWLPMGSARSMHGSGSLWSRAVRSILAVAATLAGWHRGKYVEPMDHREMWTQARN